MFLVTSLLIAMLVALVRGGRIRSFARIELYNPFLILAGLALRILIFSTPWQQAVGSGEAISRILYVLSMALVLEGIYFNRQIPGLKLIGLGVLFNFLVVVANGGYMPVSAAAAGGLRISPMPERILVNEPRTQAVVVTENTKLWFLGDVIPLPGFLPMDWISVGDIALCVGVFCGTQRIMLREERAREG